jgi:hypothetical protein
MTRTSAASTGTLIALNTSVNRLLDTEGEVKSALDLILNIRFVAVVAKYYFVT